MIDIVSSIYIHTYARYKKSLCWDRIYMYLVTPKQHLMLNWWKVKKQWGWVEKKRYL